MRFVPGAVLTAGKDDCTVPKKMEAVKGRPKQTIAEETRNPDMADCQAQGPEWKAAPPPPPPMAGRGDGSFFDTSLAGYWQGSIKHRDASYYCCEIEGHAGQQGRRQGPDGADSWLQ